MQPPLLSIDRNHDSLDDAQVTGKLIDNYISLRSFHFLDTPKRKEHVLELVTHKLSYWERLVNEANELYWLNKEGRGLAIFLPNQDCGFTRTYRFRPSKEHDLHRNIPWSFGTWKRIQCESALLDILNSIEHTTIFKNWKAHKINVNKIPTEFAEGRLSNTAIDKVMLVTKGSGCAVCGQSAGHHATTTLSGINNVMISISMCEKHKTEASNHSCILSFFGTLFFFNMDIPDLIKLDHIPDELVNSISGIIADYLFAKFETPKKKENGWHIRFSMQDGWSWLLRLNKLTDYAYMLFNSSGKQVHRIDSANDHPDVPFGPDHQHFNPKTKREAIKPSFSYGIPLFDFPLLEKSKQHHKGQ